MINNHMTLWDELLIKKETLANESQNFVQNDKYDTLSKLAYLIDDLKMSYNIFERLKLRMVRDDPHPDLDDSKYYHDIYIGLDEQDPRQKITRLYWGDTSLLGLSFFRK